jgi:DNA-binding MarR family transcriptional regulator
VHPDLDNLVADCSTEVHGQVFKWVAASTTGAHTAVHGVVTRTFQDVDDLEALSAAAGGCGVQHERGKGIDTDQQLWRFTGYVGNDIRAQGNERIRPALLIKRLVQLKQLRSHWCFGSTRHAKRYVQNTSMSNSSLWHISLSNYGRFMHDNPIDHLVSDWAEQLPGLSTTAMATVARLNRAAASVRQQVDEFFANEGISTGEFDVLSALRRQGTPYRLMPSQLARVVMLSPSGMTSRVDGLEVAGLIKRIVDPDNRRVAPVELTNNGKRTIDALIDRYAAFLNGLLSSLSAAQHRQLDGSLQKLLTGLES